MTNSKSATIPFRTPHVAQKFPNRCGRYQIVRPIASGGMAEIFYAIGIEPNGDYQEYAIKRLLPEYAESTELVDLLIDEFRLVSHLNHINITKMFEIARTGKDVFLVMEYVQGKDLREIASNQARKGNDFNIADAVYLTEQVLDGLDHAHHAHNHQGEPLQIVHRDISPSNILIAEDGAVKLCDFGIAKAKDSRVQTMAGFVRGKIHYMSPEQANGEKIDARSDLFSTASVLYELLTGMKPFSGRNEIELLYAVRQAYVKPCHQINPRVPEKLSKIIARAMTQSREQRFQLARDFRNQLSNFRLQHAPRYESQLGKLVKDRMGDPQTQLNVWELPSHQITHPTDFSIKASQTDPNRKSGINVRAEPTAKLPEQQTQKVKSILNLRGRRYTPLQRKR